MTKGEQHMPHKDDYLAESKESSEQEGDMFGAERVELERRCKAANILVAEEESGIEEGDKNLRVDLPAGREKRGIILWDAEDMQAFLSISFEKYVFLPRYEAICSYEGGSIEALISSFGRSRYFLDRYLLDRGRGRRKKESLFSLPSPDKRVLVSLGPASKDLRILVSRSSSRGLSLRISGLDVQRHANAVDILRRVSDSLFFQIELSNDILFTLVRRRHSIFRGRRALEKRFGDQVKFPTQEYDKDPMSLYWYGRSASGMPLLQFLAYYQAIEFYFPTYYEAETYRKVRRILKDPAFRSDRDADIGRVLSSLTVGRGTRGDERSMVRATLQECVSPNELRAFLLSDDSRKKFFSSKTEGLTHVKLPLRNPNADLRNDVADRIYDIRCKIVHTKSDSGEGETKPLLPFSKEADRLYHDIDLVQYLAQQTLITASASLRV